MSYLVGQMKNLPSLHDITSKSIPHGHNDMTSKPQTFSYIETMAWT
jgi:hypothetical protein